MPTYIGYTSGTRPTISDTAWDQRAKMMLALGGGGVGPPPLGAAPELYQDVFDDPNVANVIPNKPNNPARYSQLQSSGGSGVEWHWQKDTHVWI